MSLRSSVVSNIIFEAVVFAWNTPNEAERELLLSSVDILGKAENIDVQTLRYALEHCDAREDTRLSVVNSCLPVLRRVFEVRQRAWNVNSEYGSGVNDWQWQRYVEPIDAALTRIRGDLATPGNLKDDLRELVEAAQAMLSWEISPDIGIPDSSSVVMSVWPCFAWGVSLHQLGDAASTLDDVLSSIGDAEMFVTGSDCIPRPITIPYGMCAYIGQWDFGPPSAPYASHPIQFMSSAPTTTGMALCLHAIRACSVIKFNSVVTVVLGLLEFMLWAKKGKFQVSKRSMVILINKQTLFSTFGALRLCLKCGF